MANILNHNSFHLVGIKGVAMTALALILNDLGKVVTGSDVSGVFLTEEMLQQRGFKIAKNFNPINIDKAEVVVHSASHLGSNNIEVVSAIKKQKKVVCLPELMGELSLKKNTIAISGCHGKSTTSALISYLLFKLKKDPSYLVGTAGFMNMESGRWGSGRYFVVEADEYLADPVANRIPKFLFLHPQYIIATNLDYDHPDFFPNLKSVTKAYLKFFGRLRKSGKLIINADDSALVKLAKESGQPFVTYGYGAKSQYKIKIEANGFSVYRQQKKLISLKPRLIGRHNFSNVTAAVCLFHQLGINLSQTAVYFNQFRGAKRRIEFISKHKNNYLYDDYAHHPQEIIATVDALKNKYPKHRLALCFQPHTYSRTRKLLLEFASALSRADYLGLLPIFASARELSDTGFSTNNLISSLPKNCRCLLLDNKRKWQALVKTTQRLYPKWIYVTMGAGNVDSYIPVLQQYLHE
jgi:UDP-N-acetylmuramate--alanine ligase